jgi:hypothetical protein
MAIQKLSGSISSSPSYTVPSSASNTDKNVLAPAVNRLVDAFNALEVKVAALQPAPTPVPTPSPLPTVRITISAEVESAILALARGQGFVLAGPTADIECRVEATA